MATASQVKLVPTTTGVFHAPSIASESCDTASDLLQENHEKHHVFFNKSGFHNHMAHHLLTIFALGASSDDLQKAFDRNKDEQRPQYPISEDNVSAMHDTKKWEGFLGKEKYFHDFETFYKREIDQKGWQAVLQEHLLARTERAENLFVRMHAGFFHPLIHLGFGVEFQQPAIIVEALAQAAVHDSWMGRFLLGAEKAARASSGSPKSLPQLLGEIRDNDRIRKSPHWGDGNKIRDGVLVRAGPEIIDLAAQWRVKPDELERKTSEMVDACAYFTGAAQRPDKQVKFDFFYMHSMNCSVFFSAFLKEDWLGTEDKCRLLEWKARTDLVMYASRGSPELLLEQITDYKPKKPDGGWNEIMARVNRFPDDGHASKFIRALANGERTCRKFEAGAHKSDFMIKDGMWLKLGHMVVDSVEADGPRWVRNTGFAEAWKDVPDRAKL